MLYFEVSILPLFIAWTEDSDVVKAYLCGKRALGPEETVVGSPFGQFRHQLSGQRLPQIDVNRQKTMLVWACFDDLDAR